MKIEIDIRVAPFARLKERYSIEYRYLNIPYFFGQLRKNSQWNTLCVAWINSLREDLCTIDQPKLFGDFDDAIAYASDLTYESIQVHNRNELQKYNAHILEIRQTIASRG